MKLFFTFLILLLLFVGNCAEEEGSISLGDSSGYWDSAVWDSSQWGE